MIRALKVREFTPHFAVYLDHAFEGSVYQSIFTRAVMLYACPRDHLSRLGVLKFGLFLSLLHPQNRPFISSLELDVAS
jgi:hypothetical protein